MKKFNQLSHIFITTDKVGRLLVCDFFMCGTEWRVVYVYVSNENSDRYAFLLEVEAYLN